MSVPKELADLLARVTIGRAGAPVNLGTGPMPDDDWTKVDLGELTVAFLECDHKANKTVLLAAETDTSLPFHLGTAEGIVSLPHPFGPSSYLWAQSDTSASGGALRVFGFRPEPKA